jgi:sugar fermentation stimulation protein A
LGANCGVCLGALLPALFKARLSRFLAEVSLAGEGYLVHIPNTGRLDYALTPGARVWLKRVRRTGRTQYDVVLAECGETRVVVDSSLQNRLVAAAVRCRVIAELAGYTICKEEVTIHGSRLDFMLCSGERKYFLEVKGCTLAEHGCALYPDAPTLRGRKHLATLVKLVEEGFKSGVLFVALRDDVAGFKANTKIDPEFSHELSQARDSGVDVMAYRVSVGVDVASIESTIPVELN